jgi:hypothetical protein
MYLQASRVAALCEEQGIVVRVLSDIFNLRLAKSRAGEFAGEAITRFPPGRRTAGSTSSSAPWMSRFRCW